MADLSALRGFLLDMDGTVYLSERLLPGAAEFLAALRHREHPFLFFTNNSSTTGSAYSERLRRLGLPARREDVLTSGDAAIAWLRARGLRRLCLLATPAVEAEFAAAGFELEGAGGRGAPPEAVVLAFDKSLTYEKLARAARHLDEGALFVATHPDKVCPIAGGRIPDVGAMLALFESACERRPDAVIGKPSPLMVEMALPRLGRCAEEVAIIGDRTYTDMRMGRAAGLTTILVLSGETRADPGSPDVDFVFDDLAHVGRAIFG
jgi:4-nitrophenyl phosphatase/NagD protein